MNLASILWLFDSWEPKVGNLHILSPKVKIIFIPFAQISYPLYAWIPRVIWTISPFADSRIVLKAVRPGVWSYLEVVILHPAFYLGMYLRPSKSFVDGPYTLNWCYTLV